MTIYAIERTKFDISAAERLGDVYYLYDDAEPRSSVFSTTFYEDTLYRLQKRGFDPLNDKILCTGSLVPLLTTVAAVAAKYKTVTLLLFHAAKAAYSEVTVRCDQN